MSIVLTETEQIVFEATKEGAWANFDLNTNSEIRSAFLRALVRRVPVSDNMGAELELKAMHADVRVRGAVIEGDLDLDDCTGLPRLLLEACHFKGKVLLNNAELRRFSLKGSHINEIHMRGVRLGGTFDLSEVRSATGDKAPAWIDARGCTVQGSLEANGAKLRAPSARRREAIPAGQAIYALQLSDADIQGSIELNDLVAHGGINLSAAHIRKNVVAWGTVMTAGEQDALRAQAITVDGVVMLNELRAFGRVWLLGARIGGTMQLDGAVIKNQATEGDSAALIADSAEVKGHIFIGDGFCAEGNVSLASAKIAGNLVCTGGKFSNRTSDGTGYALNVDTADITGDIRFNGKFTAEGMVSLAGTKLRGNLDCAGAIFANRISSGDSWALMADVVDIAGFVSLRDNFYADGRVSFNGASIGGRFEFIDATIRNEGASGRSIALHLLNTTIGRGAYFIHSSIVGAVCFLNAKLGGDLQCHSANFIALPDVFHEPEQWESALSATNVTINGDVFFTNTQVIGQLLFGHANIVGDLRWTALHFPTKIEVDDFTLQDGELTLRTVEWSYNGILLTDDENKNAEQPHPTDGALDKPAARLVLAHAKIGAALQAHELSAAVPLLVDLSAAQVYTLDDEGFPAGWGNSEAGDKQGALPITRLDLDGFVYQRLEHFPVEMHGEPVSPMWLPNVVPTFAKNVAALEWTILQLLEESRLGHRIVPWLEDWRKEANWKDFATPRLKWLQRQFLPSEGVFYPQPYEHLASVMRVQGHVGTARKIAIAAAHAAPYGLWSPIRRFFWGRLFGFGLAPLNASLTLMAVLLFGFYFVHRAWNEPWLDTQHRWNNSHSVLVLTAKRREVLVDSSSVPGTKPTARDVQCGKTEIQPFYYAMDMILPVVPLHQEERCELADRSDTAWWRVLWALYSIVGKITASLALLTYSGVLKPR